MTSTGTPTPLIVKITNHLSLIEKIFLTALIIGIVLLKFQIESSLIKISLIGLAVTFFLSAYRPSEVLRQDNDQPLNFSELLGLLILPKVLWISSAISALGIAFFLFDFGNDGYKRLLIIGGLTIGIALIILAALLVGGIRQLKIVVPVLLRALPLLLTDIYILLIE